MIVRHATLFIALLATLALPAQAATPAEKAALAALTAYMHARGNHDIEQPECYVVQSWAFCRFTTYNGMANTQNFLHQKNGRWIFLGQEGGFSSASLMESKYGIPSSVARLFVIRERS